MMMDEFNGIDITPELLFRLGFEEEATEIWQHYPADFNILKQDDGNYVQWIKDWDNIVGWPMKYIGELQIRCLSMCGYQLCFKSGDEPRTDQ